MKQRCLPVNHEPSINRMAVIMANEDIANEYCDNWDVTYESSWDILKKQEIFDTIERYYDVDLDNCTMTHEDWIKQIVEALTDDKYLKKMMVLFHEYEDERKREGGVMSNETKDWREDFYEVRVFASKPIEFTMTVKANDEADAVEEAGKMLDKMTDEDIVAHDNYGEPLSYDSGEWCVIDIEEAFGFENTPEDFKEAKLVAWNVEDES